MNSTVIGIIVMMSTTWMLTVLNHHHYQQLTAQALLKQIRQEYLLEALYTYANAYVRHKKIISPIKILFPPDPTIEIALHPEGERFLVRVTIASVVYETTIS